MAPGLVENFLGTNMPIRSKQHQPHPLAPLSASEVTTASQLIQQAWPSGTELHFKAITLDEPPKDLVLPYLEAEHAASALPFVPRKAFVNYYIRNTNKFHEAVVNLSERKVDRSVLLGPNLHACGDGYEIGLIETIALEDEGVKAEIAKLQLPEGSVIVIDPWIYGADGVNDDDRMWQCFMYMRDPSNSQEPDSCHYAFPLPISPVVCTTSWKVVRIDIMPTGADNTVKPIQPWTKKPANEYIPELQSLRSDLKPLHVVQPEGASFTVQEQEQSSVIEWQKWRFRVGFNAREGMVLYDIRYDGRSLFYRFALSDMNIPYADGRNPFHRKSAFDLGDAGAGIMANNLKLGCDCLGSIYYLSAMLNDDKGQPVEMPNVVCIHEQDAGIGWKHTNYRTGRACVVRKRQLVLQSILTVANYEYILNVMFDQAGEIDYEVRATGILSTQPIDEGIEVPFGTVVHPGVLAVHHQHIFSLRVDPFLDGSNSNRLVFDEAHTIPRSKEMNPHGNAYVVQETPVAISGGYDVDPLKNRTFKIQNVEKRNPINGKPVAYKIHIPPMQPILSDTESFNHRRAEFSDHNLYVTSYRDGELYAGGQYTNQSRGGTGVRSWANRKDNVLDTDIVLFVNFGINHVPRIEDFPVMPCEILKVAFKPVNFFDRNPAIDVPPSTQGFNQSIPLNNGVNGSHGANGSNGTYGLNGSNGANGQCCNVSAH